MKQNVVHRNEQNRENLRIEMTCLKCHRNIARVFVVCVFDYTREVIKKQKKFTLTIYNTHCTIYGILLVLA